MGNYEEQKIYFYPLVVAFCVSLVITIGVTAWQVKEIMEMKFVAKNGYSKKWKTTDRLAGTSNGEDPRYSAIFMQYALTTSQKDFD